MDIVFLAAVPTAVVAILAGPWWAAGTFAAVFCLIAFGD